MNESPGLLPLLTDLPTLVLQRDPHPPSQPHTLTRPRESTVHAPRQRPLVISAAAHSTDLTPLIWSGQDHKNATRSEPNAANGRDGGSRRERARRSALGTHTSRARLSRVRGGVAVTTNATDGLAFLQSATILDNNATPTSNCVRVAVTFGCLPSALPRAALLWMQGAAASLLPPPVPVEPVPTTS